jgi:DNA-binding PadR family transcriptional regulator
MPPLKRLMELNTTGCLWTYVLRILEDGPVHAYAIRAEIERRYKFRPGNVTSYKVIYLLARSGLVKKRQEGRRVMYEITGKGRETLKAAVGFYKERARLLGK